MSTEGPALKAAKERAKALFMAFDALKAQPGYEAEMAESKRGARDAYAGVLAIIEDGGAREADLVRVIDSLCEIMRICALAGAALHDGDAGLFDKLQAAASTGKAGRDRPH